MCDRGVCMAGGMCGMGVHGGGMCGREVCMVGGMHGRGACIVGGPCMAGGMHGMHTPFRQILRDTVNERVVRILTGMHSCLSCNKKTELTSHHFFSALLL